MEQATKIDLNEYIAQKNVEGSGVKLVALDGLAYFQLKNFDPRTGKRLPPQLFPVSSEGIQETIDLLEKDLANHRVLLADVKAAEAK